MQAFVVPVGEVHAPVMLRHAMNAGLIVISDPFGYLYLSDPGDTKRRLGNSFINPITANGIFITHHQPIAAFAKTVTMSHAVNIVTPLSVRTPDGIDELKGTAVENVNTGVVHAHKNITVRNSHISYLSVKCLFSIFPHPRIDASDQLACRQVQQKNRTVGGIIVGNK